MLWIYLGIYLSGVIVSLAILVYMLYKDWYNGYPITLGDVIAASLLPLLSWVTMLGIGVLSLDENSDMVIIEGRDHAEEV